MRNTTMREKLSEIWEPRTEEEMKNIEESTEQRRERWRNDKRQRRELKKLKLISGTLETGIRSVQAIDEAIHEDREQGTGNREQGTSRTVLSQSAKIREEFAIPPGNGSQAQVSNTEPPQEENTVTVSAPQYARPTAPDTNKADYFTGDLKRIVDKVRDARQRVIFAMEQIEKRRAEYRTKLEEYQNKYNHEDAAYHEQKKKLAELDNTISAATLLAEQTAAIDPLLLNGVGAKHHNNDGEKRARTPSGDENYLHSSDIRKHFEKNPNTNWSVKEILAEMPHKRTASKSIGAAATAILADLHKKGFIERVAVGVYRKAGTEGQTAFAGVLTDDRGIVVVKTAPCL